MIDFIKICWEDKRVIEPFIMDEKNFKKLHPNLELHSGEIIL